ncbi:Murein hydrolase activator NlpD [Calidithermus terrae]|uniref:Murein hydrolase activator NlpD n=1 Tax=Calidithermus terrae TaxID=1408545 RepID=A0A399EFY8_9DEIN|nr:M23 family metallopeptidase [Calidithermus terrae]RIH81142.1 Murein hydrolase activator NlpD [Calidithermus terrae]
MANVKRLYFHPCLPAHRYSVQPGCGFLDPAYEQATGWLHPGADYNGRGGGDTDLGDPVYAVTDGTVVEVGFFKVWGNLVLIHHEGPGVWTLSAHCDQVLVQAGQRVRAGQQIGTIGKGDTRVKKPYRAHLHFEVRLFGPERIPINDWPTATFKNRRDKALVEILHTRVDPERWLEKMHALPVLPGRGLSRGRGRRARRLEERSPAH